jgi:hypothetical protein
VKYVIILRTDSNTYSQSEYIQYAYPTQYILSGEYPEYLPCLLQQSLQSPDASLEKGHFPQNGITNLFLILLQETPSKIDQSDGQKHRIYSARGNSGRFM